MPPLLIVVLDVTVLDVLPLALFVLSANGLNTRKRAGTYALVDAVPDPVRSGVECPVTQPSAAALCIPNLIASIDVQLDTEGADKDGGQEDGIPLEEGAGAGVSGRGAVVRASEKTCL